MSPDKPYAGGLTLNFLESSDFESMTPNNDKAITNNVLRLLMMGWKSNWSDILSWRLIKAVLIQRDHTLLRNMRLSFQDGFKRIYTQLKARTLNEQQHQQACLFISNVLCFLPYADLTPYESMAIPQWVNNEWQLIDYKITPIELTPTTGFNKLFLHETDRVFAYGLEPISQGEAESLLVFMGTTYPKGQGFMSHINTDLEGFATVGEQLYRSGRERIKQWLDMQTKKVHVCGTSLGGSLSLLLAIDQGDRLSRVDALNPAGLYSSWRKNVLDRWDDLSEKPPVIIQLQGNDPVSRFGLWKNNWTLLQVTPSPDKQGSNFFIDHAINYAGFSDTKFTVLDTIENNKTRRARNFWLYTLLRSIVYYLNIVPYYYLIRPILYYTFNHKRLLLLTALSYLVLFYLQPLWIISLSAQVAYGLASVPFMGSLLYSIGQGISVLLGHNKIETIPDHAATFPRNKELDIDANEVQQTFSSKELGDYYYLKDCLMKEKSAPQLNPQSNEDCDSLSKQELINNRLNDKIYPIPIKCSKANMYEIHHTVELINRFGLYSDKFKKSNTDHPFVLFKKGP